MLKAGESRLVFTSSVAATLGLVNHEAISAAKAGVEGMVRSAAATYARRGLRINAVAPDSPTLVLHPSLQNQMWFEKWPQI